jgi:hypothetical protein
MATSGTPFEGRDSYIVPLVYVSGSLDMRLYTNTANSLSTTSVLADLTYPSGSGYATVTLSGTWTSSNGVVTYDDGTPDNVKFTAGDDWTGGDVVGVAITDGTYLIHFKDLDIGPTTMTTGTIIEVDLSTFISAP